MRIVVTAGAIIQDASGRILLQRRSDFGNWGLPGGGMDAGEAVEETMIREVREETGLIITEYELYAVYSGPRMQYRYPDGNEVVFVMFLFRAEVDWAENMGEDGVTLLYLDNAGESLQLRYTDLEEIDLSQISSVQRPVFEDLLEGKVTILRS